MATEYTTTYSLAKPEVGASEDTWGGILNSNADAIDDLLDGTTAIAPNLTAGSWEVGGVAVTSTAAELNLLDGVTYTLTDLNSLTATVTELNYVDGVTSAIQTQLDGKQTIDATLTAYAGTLTAANKIPYATATDTAGELDFVDEDDMASDSATAVPSQQSVKAYVNAVSPIVEIARINLSNQATAEFTGFDSAEYVSYEFEFINVVPATDGAVMRVQTSADGGTTYDSGASDYAYTIEQRISSGTGSSINSSGSDSMRLHREGVGSGSGDDGFCGTARLMGAGNAKETFLLGNVGFTISGGGGQLVGGTFTARRSASSVVTAIKFFFDTGNLESGTIIMRGYRGA